MIIVKNIKSVIHIIIGAVGFIAVALAYVLHVEHIEYGFDNPGIAINSVIIINLALIIGYILSLTGIIINRCNNILKVIFYIALQAAIIGRFVFILNTLISYAA